MYLIYLLPTLTFGYGFINANLALDFFDWYRRQEKEVEPPEIELVSMSEGEGTRVQNQLVENHVASSSLTPTVDTDRKSESTKYLISVTVLDEEGKTHLPVQLIKYVEVKEKRYWAHTTGDVFQIRKTIAELDTELDPALFYRLNRSVIINLRYVKNYSYWEYDKYIVRLNDGKSEFTMQRGRAKELKERLAVLG